MGAILIETPTAGTPGGTGDDESRGVLISELPVHFFCSSLSVPASCSSPKGLQIQAPCVGFGSTQEWLARPCCIGFTLMALPLCFP